MKFKKLKKPIAIAHTPLENKHFFIGVALGENSTSETGIAVLNRDLQLLHIDKLYLNADIEAYIKTFSGKTDAIVNISLAQTDMQLNSKWRQDEKNIHAFTLFNDTEDLHWTGRFSERGNDLYDTLNALGISSFRYNIHISKMRLNLIPPFKKRSQPGCRYLQTVIKDYLSVDNLPSNLVAISALDAMIGAYTGWKMATDKENKGYMFLEPYKGQKVVAPLKPNPRPVTEEDYQKEVKPKKKR